MHDLLTLWLSVWGILTLVGCILWLVSLLIRDASIVDPVWGLLFVTAALLFANSLGYSERNLLILALVLLWGLRLSAYLTWRNWGKPEDHRYQSMRARDGANFWIISLFRVFVLQTTLAWLISATLLAAFSGPDTLIWLDGVALIVWLIGFYFETVGDWQLARFRSKAANRGLLLTEGLWRYTRHPNYFGDAACWWAFGLFALGAGRFWGIGGALIMTWLLLRISGVTLLEKSLSKSKLGYENYRKKTSAFIPWWPGKD